MLILLLLIRRAYLLYRIVRAVRVFRFSKTLLRRTGRHYIILIPRVWSESRIALYFAEEKKKKKIGEKILEKDP